LGRALWSVTISPDPIELGKPVDTTFSGALNVDIPEDPSKTITQVPFVDSKYVPIVDPFTTEFCTIEGIKCPIPAGTKFNVVNFYQN
jgi:hypothetical protein